jgi:hypothetical protein
VRSPSTGERSSAVDAGVAARGLEAVAKGLDLSTTV